MRTVLRGPRQQPDAGVNFHRTVRRYYETKIDLSPEQLAEIAAGPRVDLPALERSYQSWLRKQPADHPWRVTGEGGEV